MKNSSLRAPFNLQDENLVVLSAKIRKSVFEVCLTAGNGHIGGSSGAVELLTTLYFGGILRYNPTDAQDSRRDRVLIRGHLGPVRYSIFSEIGFISKEELSTYRTFGSRLQGHEDHTATPGVDITPSGSLGMSLSFGIGAAVAARHNGEAFRTFVFIGDGEEQEGNVSEAARHASRLGLNNLIAVLDANGKQLSDPVSSTDHADIAAIWRGYGWNVIILADGHNIAAIKSAYSKAVENLVNNKPVLIIASTIKGKGLDGAEAHFSGFHTVSVCSKDTITQGINVANIELSRMNQVFEVEPSNPDCQSSSVDPVSAVFKKLSLGIEPSSNEGCLSKWQGKYFQGLKSLILPKKFPIFFLTADVTRKDFVDELGLRDFLLYDNVGLREQHLMAYSHGISLSMPSSRIIVNSFDAFMYRGLDQLHAMAHGGGSAVILGDYSGLTNARNGSTHQSSSQPGAIMAMPKVTFLEPWDSVDLFNCLNWAIGESRGVVYIRIHSGPVAVHKRSPSNSKCTSFYRLFGDMENPDIVIVSSGFPVGDCLRAAEELSIQGISARVINIVDHRSLSEFFVAELSAGKPVLTVYNGSSQFLQSNVSSAVMRSPVRTPSRIEGVGFDLGTTGHLHDLVRHYGLDAEGILKSAKALL
ncbi:MAG: transketolase C-terminal domain-containing protein [bacterium]|nr:transketolase C-terminal domain-containing protein [bacterium]